MTMEGWNGQVGGAGWWARALSFAGVLGLLLGIVGPFGSYLNGDVLTRIADWVGMTLVGTVIAGIVVPLAVRTGVRLGLPRAFVVAVGLLLAAVPISVVSAFVARSIWPWQTAALRPLDWYGQTLLVELCVVTLWLLVESARKQRSTAGRIAPVRDEAEPGAPLSADPVLCLQMEDHYVRVHRASGSTLELMTLADAIARYGATDGLQVHRSWWVSAGSVTEGERDARNWRLRLVNGLLVPIARNRILDVRTRGWIEAAE